MSRLLEINTPLGPDNVVLANLSGHEELGVLPAFQLTLVARRGDVKAADLLGKNISIGIEVSGGGDLRYLNGYITRFADAGHTTASYLREGNVGRAYLYLATLHPWLWFLTRASNCRIFQNKTVPQILDDVFAAYPFALVDKGSLSGNYRAWEYCCQYRETDFNFVSRLMEQEGIYYYFDHADGKHTMILCDSPNAHTPFPGYRQIPFSDEVGAGGATDKEYLNDWNVTHEIQPGRVALSDFDFSKPKVDLSVKASGPGTHDLSNFEIFDFPGEYQQLDEGNQYAGIRLEAMQARHEVATGAGPVRGIQPGRTFNLTDYPRAAANKAYLVIAANYTMSNNQPGSGDGSGADFQVSFQAIDAKVNFRPQRSTPRPVVQGPQTAMVVGPAGEEIHTDKYGRVTVQFHWDRYGEANENSSCWVRVSQPWAGKGWGGIAIPRIGQEVIVEFMEGDPDQPIITGRAYNADAMPPWELPANKTRSGMKTRTYRGGNNNFNEWRFEDKPGEEEIYTHAERDQVVRSKHDRIEWVGNESHLIVKQDIFEQCDGEHHLQVTGDQNIKLGGSYSLQTAQDWLGKVGSKLAVDAGQEIHLKAGMKLVIEAGTQISFKVGGNFIDIGPAGVMVQGTLVKINSGGSPGSGSGASPQAPKAPKEAGDSTGGEQQESMRPKKPEAYSPQAQALKLARRNGTPFSAVAPDAAGAAETPTISA